MATQTSKLSDNSFRPGLKGWVVTIMVLIFMIINFGDKAVLGLAAEPIIKEFGLTNTEFGYLASSFYLLFSIAAAIGGFLSVKFSTKRILFAMSLLWGIFMLPVIAFAGIAALYISRMGLGIAEGPASPMGVHAVHKWFPEDKQTLPTILTQVGGGLGVFIAGPILTHVIFHQSWRMAFIDLAICSFIWCVIWGYVAKEGPLETYAAKVSGKNAAEEAGNMDESFDPKVPYHKLFFSRTWIGALIGGYGAYWVLALGIAWLPKLLDIGFGFSHSQIGVMVAIPPAIMVFIMIAFPLVTDRIIKRGATIRSAWGISAGVALAICGLLGFLVAFVHGTPQVVLLFLFTGLPPFAYPIGYLMVSRMTPVKNRGPLLGVQVGLVTSAGLLAPVVSGAIMDAAATQAEGFTNLFLFTGVLMIVTGLISAAMCHPDADIKRLGLDEYR